MGCREELSWKSRKMKKRSCAGWGFQRGDCWVPKAYRGSKDREIRTTEKKKKKKTAEQNFAFGATGSKKKFKTAP